MFTLGIRDTLVSSIKHSLFPLCICFEIIPDNLLGVVILFYPLSSAKLLIYICLKSLLHTTLVHSFPFSFHKFFRQFCRFLERIKRADANPETLVFFLHPLCVHRSVGPGLEASCRVTWKLRVEKTICGQSLGRHILDRKYNIVAYSICLKYETCCHIFLKNYLKFSKTGWY